MNKEINDLTVISSVMMADGISRQGVGIISAVQDSLSVNAYQLSTKNYKDVPPEVLNVLIKPFNGFGKVSFWTYILGINTETLPLHNSITSQFKIAYSMFESDAVPELWVAILNKYYDIVVVPDEFLVSVYKNSGVKIPIFVIPLGIFVEDLLKAPAKEKANSPFIFGMSAGFWKRKNHIKLMQAFNKEFGNNKNFKLKVHGRFGPYKAEVEKAFKSLNCNNIELLTSPLSIKDYNQFMEDIDCYVFPSSGEGYSITPRETLALGKPCIVANNTAQTTICNSGFVIPLPATKKVQAIYEIFGTKPIGNYFDCNVDDLSKLMKEVANNYDKYLKIAQGGREWVKQALWSELKPTYLNLFKPTNIVFGETNLVSPTMFQTNNKPLFDKLKAIFP